MSKMKENFWRRHSYVSNFQRQAAKLKANADDDDANYINC